MKPEDVKLGAVYFEMVSVGNYVRVAAIDSRTNIEITMVGDPQVGEENLKRAAVRKLRYVIAKKRPDPEDDGSIIA